MQQPNAQQQQPQSMLARLASRARQSSQQQQPQGNGNGNQQQQNPNNQQQQPQGGRMNQGNQQPQMKQNDPTGWGTGGPGSNMNGDQNNEDSGLDFLNGIFDNHQQTDAPPQFALDDATLDKGMSSLDFMKSMPPELQAKLQAGDPSAMFDAMQHVGRQAYRAAMQHGALVGGKYHDIRSEHSNKGFEGRVKDVMLQDGMMSDESIPQAARPLFADITKRLKTQYPDATPAELKQATREWFQKMNSKLNPGTGNNNSGGERLEHVETNYDDFFGSAPPDLQEVPLN